MFQRLHDLYRHLQNTLIWFVIYFILQTIIWIALAILIWFYPQALFVIVAVMFILLAIISLYFAIMFIRYAVKLKDLKKLIKK
jgi:hypothetical protein